MASGKKAVAERIVYRAFDIVAEKAKDDPVKVWDRALSNVQPKVEVKSRRVGGATYQVPGRRPPGTRAGAGHALAHLRGARPLREARCRRSWPASFWTPPRTRGNAVKKREDTHKMADANKAFAHYRW